MTTPNTTSESWEREINQMVINDSMSPFIGNRLVEMINQLIAKKEAEAVNKWLKENQPVITDFTCSNHADPIPTCLTCCTDDIAEAFERGKDRVVNTVWNWVHENSSHASSHPESDFAKMLEEARNLTP